jgi:serine/threonine protein kinase
MPKPGDRISEYVLDEPIGKGAFGEVWRARHHVWTDQLKFPADPQYLRQLQREGLVAAGFDHSNIVRPIGFDPFTNPPYLVMEYVAGESLRSLIDRRGASFVEAIDIVRQVLEGLKYAHDRGVIHRDLKPENVLISTPSPGTPGERRGGGFSSQAARIAKITDFGLAKPQTAVAESIVFSRSMDDASARKIAGTIEYMSPEQRAGAAVDGRTDLYAVGVIFHELLSGERPAGVELPSHVNPSLPAWVDEIFRRAYARLDRRFGSAAEMIAAIDRHRGADGKVGAQDTGKNVSAAGAKAASPPPLPSVPARSPAICPQCRHRVEPDDQFCIHCGVQLVREVRRCANCDAYPALDDEYCSFCGAQLAAPALGRSA